MGNLTCTATAGTKRKSYMLLEQNLSNFIFFLNVTMDEITDIIPHTKSCCFESKIS